MNVKLAVQVLSSIVSNVLTDFGPPDAAGTETFCMLMDSFCDITNVGNTQESHIKQKPFLAPFKSVNDERFIWLKNIFLKYFEDWQLSIRTPPGNFTKTAQSNVFISWQTYEGIKIAINLLIEVVRYLLD